MFKSLRKDAASSSSSAPGSTNGVDCDASPVQESAAPGLLAPLQGRFRSRTADTKENQVANIRDHPASKSGSALNLPPQQLQRPASEGSSRAPSPDELEAFVVLVKDRLKAHSYLPTMPDVDIKRFLVAHRNNQANALKQVHATLDWRHNFNFNSILTEDFSDLEATGKLTIDSTDFQQNAVMVWQQHLHTPLLPPSSSSAVSPSSSTITSATASSSFSTATATTTASRKEDKEALLLSTEKNLRFFVYTIERAKQTHRLRPDNKLTVLVDRLGMTPINYDQPLGKAIVGVMQHYPDLFEAYYVFPKNAMLMVAWKLTRVFLDPVTVARIKLLGEAEVKSVLVGVMAKGELLVRYGGEKGGGEEVGAASVEKGCVVGRGVGSGAGVDISVEDADDEEDEFLDADGV
ncbi:hypothetical protein HDU98_012140 [Podochytrium sp. JEL0797]|nr:hypothetical protein HDU98_012140 [Podochytrium sp. JEL0797]